MKSSLRPTSLDDLAKLSQFLQEAFGTSAEAPFLNPTLMAWKYWDRRDDWEGPRSYVLERDGAIVAHAGIYPLTFGPQTNEEAVRGIHMIDWASAKDSPGAGVAILQKLAAMFDFILAIGGSEMTCKVLPAFGFVECARQWRGARPLRPVQQIRNHQYRNWKLAPRLARNAWWALSKPARLNEKWQVEEIGLGELAGGFYSSHVADVHFTRRPPEYFEYLLRCPAMKMHLYGIRDDQEPTGHFAVGVLRGQARIAGVWLSKSTREAWETAFALGQQAAKRLEGAYEVVTAGSEGASEAGALAAGLRIVGHSPVYLLNKKGNLTLPPDFQFQLSDDDEFLLDVGNPAYWT
ncbi:MAG: hypothetical protein WA324_15575 [Bryobacteraceae bacterium]